MFDFSGDEGLALIASGMIALGGFVGFYRPLFLIPLLGRTAGARVILAILPPIILLATAAILNSWADAQVAGHADYILLFLVVEMAWLTATFQVLRLFGISIRDDVIDRGNRAALIAACGGIIGVSIIYAMANIGGGPTIWTTIGPAILGTFAMFVVWLLMEVAGNIFETIAVDRDIAGGLRTAGAWIACGLVLGRAVGGTWVCCDQTWMDLARFGWPVILIGAAAGLASRAMKPTARQPRPSLIFCGVVPAVVFLLLGLLAFALTPHAFTPSKW